MYHVLLPVDADVDKALRAAKTAASLPNAQNEVSATVLYVFEEFDVNEEGGRASSEELYENVDAPESLERTASYLEERGIEATARREHGDVTDTILEVAADLDADGIIITGRKQSPIGKAVFGSVTQDVLLNSDRPVTVAMAEE